MIFQKRYPLLPDSYGNCRSENIQPPVSVRSVLPYRMQNDRQENTKSHRSRSTDIPAIPAAGVSGRSGIKIRNSSQTPRIPIQIPRTPLPAAITEPTTASAAIKPYCQKYPAHLTATNKIAFTGNSNSPTWINGSFPWPEVTTAQA